MMVATIVAQIFVGFRFTTSPLPIAMEPLALLINAGQKADSQSYRHLSGNSIGMIVTEAGWA
jgi:hypothetical protein